MSNSEINRLNKKYEYNNKKGIILVNRSNINNFRIYKGTIPILLSAPHAVVQYRNATLKEADEYTGGIVEYLCKRTGAWGIIREWYAKDDPNYNSGPRSGTYRDKVVELIKQNDIYLLLDIHGYSKRNHKDIASKKIVVGTGFGSNINSDYNLNENFIDIFGDELIFDKPFPATLNNNVSRYAHNKTGISAYQCELERSCRISGNDRIDMLDKFISFINDVQDNYKIKIK